MKKKKSYLILNVHISFSLLILHHILSSFKTRLNVYYVYFMVLIKIPLLMSNKDVLLNKNNVTSHETIQINIVYLFGSFNFFK